MSNSPSMLTDVLKEYKILVFFLEKSHLVLVAFSFRV